MVSFLQTSLQSSLDYFSEFLQSGGAVAWPHCHSIIPCLVIPGGSFGDPHAEVHTLSNGLQVVLMEDPQRPCCGVANLGALWQHRRGSRNVAGIAHVFEHMLFKGVTERFPHGGNCGAD